MVPVRFERAVVVTAALTCLSVVAAEDTPRWVLALASAVVGGAVVHLARHREAAHAAQASAPSNVVPIRRGATATEGGE